MGSKTPASNDEKPSWSCEVCKRDFLSKQALRSHEIAKHPGAKSGTKKENVKPKKKLLQDTDKVSAVEIKKITPDNIPASRVSKRLQLKKGKKVEMKENSIKTDTPQKVSNEVKTSSMKTEFQCPLCDKVFSVYFSATKHIEKKHKNSDDETDLELAKPIRIEKCSLCSEVIDDEPHSCGDDDEKSSAYKCLGCQKKFSKLAAFTKHTITNHSSDADYMSFRGIHDFSTWKVNTEAQLKVKYSIFDKETKDQHHQCNYVSPKNLPNITYLCPSVIITKQLSDRLQVQYYKNHYEHTTPQYKLLDEYKKNIMDKEELNASITINNVYEKFKTLMQSIITDASKTNLDNLKKLLALAISMQTYLDEDDNELALLSRSMTDDQISDELEGKRGVRNKRRATTPEHNNTKKKSKLDDAFDSLLSPTPKSPPSFNDSYKQFIKDVKPSIVTKKTVKKEIVKTKIGQFIPSPKKTSPKNEADRKKPNILRPSKNNASPVLPDNINVNDIKYEVREQENDCNILVLKI